MEGDRSTWMSERSCLVMHVSKRQLHLLLFHQLLTSPAPIINISSSSSSSSFIIAYHYHDHPISSSSSFIIITIIIYHSAGRAIISRSEWELFNTMQIVFTDFNYSMQLTINVGDDITQVGEYDKSLLT